MKYVKKHKFFTLLTIDSAEFVKFNERGLTKSRKLNYNKPDTAKMIIFMTIPFYKNLNFVAVCLRQI